MEKAYLILENGAVFAGERFGARADALGEIVFTTGMCGYLETLTDPSYLGQIIVQTFPLIGNYGVIPEDFEGECRATGYVVREACDHPSNFRAQGLLNEFLLAKGVPGIQGVDTRALTLLLRAQGTMNGMIASEIPSDLSAVKRFRIENAVARASEKEAREVSAQGEEKYRVALMDYGAKEHIIKELSARGCRVTVWPWDARAEDVLSRHPDGVMLSNGPGDPAENAYCVREIRKLMGVLPMFGICLGHQMMALAAGARTEKLLFGHRGANQPVRDRETGRTFVTSQNHGYAVVPASLPDGAVMRFENANDHTCEGVDYPGMDAFSVQFHPEGCSGPMDTEYLFDIFRKMMEGKRHAAH